MLSSPTLSELTPRPVVFTCRISSLATTVLPKSKNDDEGTEDAGGMKSVAEKLWFHYR
jgi:hypothetical protein